jgi:short-subunit dehydrogenase
LNESNSNSLGTAIVTGASSGIGKVYADRLAARGYDLVLVARRADRLQQIAADLQERFSIRAQVLVADLSQPAGLSATIDKIASDESISVLVNNAGYSLAKPLTETASEVMANMISLNVIALTALSKAALERFALGGHGTIINIGSGAGIAPIHWIPVYGPTKAYVFQFTQILQQQVAGTDVRVQLVLPGAVVSEGWDVAGVSLDTLDPATVMTTEDCVDAALSGLDRGELITVPSLQDDTLLRNYEAAASALLQAVFENGKPATRYGLK